MRPIVNRVPVPRSGRWPVSPSAMMLRNQSYIPMCVYACIKKLATVHIRNVTG